MGRERTCVRRRWRREMAAVAYPLAARLVRMRPSLVSVPGRPAARVFRRRRAVGLALVVFVPVVGGSAVRAALSGAGGGPPPTHGSAHVARLGPAAAHSHVVGPGETLWSIVLASGDR